MLPSESNSNSRQDKHKNALTSLAVNTCCFFQALTDQQQFGKADEMYDRCIELEPDNATTYVHKGYVDM